MNFCIVAGAWLLSYKIFYSGRKLRSHRTAWTAHLIAGTTALALLLS